MKQQIISSLELRYEQDVVQARQKAREIAVKGDLAQNNHNLNVDSLVVKEAYVGKAMVMKRFHTRARGRSAQILKPFSHLTIVVREAAQE